MIVVLMGTVLYVSNDSTDYVGLTPVIPVSNHYLIVSHYLVISHCLNVRHILFELILFFEGGLVCVILECFINFLNDPYYEPQPSVHILHVRM